MHKSIIVIYLKNSQLKFYQAMIILRDLNPETKKLLTRISRASQFPQVRNRAKCIILSGHGLSLTQLMQLFGVSRRTLYNWLNQWEKQGIVGLYNQKGRGRKAKLNQEQKDQIKDWVKAEPKRLKKIASKIYKTWAVEVSPQTIKTIRCLFSRRKILVGKGFLNVNCPTFDD